MRRIGIDIGTSAIKAVCIQERDITAKIIKKHYGNILPALSGILREVTSAAGGTESAYIGVTGGNAGFLAALFPGLRRLEDIPAIVRGVRELVPGAGSIMDIGSQTARFITNLDKTAPDFAVNEHCAGGTGSFFEDQMSRLGMKIEDYSKVVAQAHSVPRLSGRCAVFAKTDIVHRQQEGVGTPDILLGLCYAMMRNFKGTIIRSLPVRKPLVFVGGVTQNAGMQRAVREILALTPEELIIPENALFAGAVGTAWEAQEIMEPGELLRAVETTQESGGARCVQAGFPSMPQLKQGTELSARSVEKAQNFGVGSLVQTELLPKLRLKSGTKLSDPAVAGIIPEGGAALGIDIGSTSTDLVLTDVNGKLLDFLYLRTAGDPEAAVRKGFRILREKYGEIRILAVGITGSGRERLGKMMKADAIRDEITAQARAAVRCVPQADTVFEIGGQDSKYISLKNGEVADFQMNKICAAGTGSFIEEQAIRMGVPLAEFGPLALTAERPAGLGERCTVFIEAAIAAAQAQGQSQADIAAGLCHSVVRNYLHKVVGNKPVGRHIVLQGGVAYNPGIVAAFQSAYPDRLTVSPYFSVSGAYGVSLLALEEVGIRVVRDEGKKKSAGEAGQMCGSEFSAAAGQECGNEFTGKAGQECGSEFTGTVKTGGKNEFAGREGEPCEVKAAGEAGQACENEFADKVREVCESDLTVKAARKSTFAGFDFLSGDTENREGSAEEERNKSFYKKAGAMLLKGYDGTVDPAKPTIGVPLSLIMYKFFPLVNSYFRDLGYNVVLSGATNEEIIALSQQYAQGETCYPVKLMYGHMAKLAQKGVDYIFMPNIHTIHHAHSGAAHNYACPYMQSAGKSVFDSLRLGERGIRLLNPVFDLDLGAQAMAGAMIGVGKSLGFSKPRCAAAVMKGAMLVRQNSAAQQKMGRELLNSLKPDEKVLVLITRAYGISDPVLNMGIPDILLSNGQKLITLGHLPADELNINDDYPNMYWPFGEHILAGAKLIAHHPNLYAVYLTNHGCGPDTLLQHMFAEEMGDKPYLQIEVDEHFSPVGVITRIEAFLNSISHDRPAPAAGNFDIRAVRRHTPNILKKPDKDKTLFVPDMGAYTGYLLDYFEKCGFRAKSMGAFTEECLERGRAETYSKEYLPFAMLTGAVLKTLESAAAEGKKPEKLQFLIPYNEGADADGQYARAIRTVLDRRGYESAAIVAPVLEHLPVTAEDPNLLVRAIAAGDLACVCGGQTSAMSISAGAGRLQIPKWPQLISEAERLGKILAGKTAERKRMLGAVGSCLTETALNDGVLETLEEEGEIILRAPVSEELLFLWNDAGGNQKAGALLTSWEKKLAELGRGLGGKSPWTDDFRRLFLIADRHLSDFSAANGRYRYAKTAAFGEEKKVSAVLMLAPRYENTAMILKMRKVDDLCGVPVMQLSPDGDFDGAAWEGLRSFLHYI